MWSTSARIPSSARGVAPMHPRPMSLMVMTYAGWNRGRMRSRPVPTTPDVHPELRNERSELCRTAACPTPAIILQACLMAPVRLVVIGIADASRCLHSVTVVEGPTEVLVRALIGWVTGPGRSDNLDYVVRRELWVTEVVLKRPLGGRLVTTDGAPSGTRAHDAGAKPSGGLAHRTRTFDSSSSHIRSVTMQVSHRNQPKEIQT